MLKGKPFVKWAGGKRQIIDKLKQYAPDNFDTYYEPFLGGGALLFELSPKKAIINDFNEELMNVFRCVKDEQKYTKMCNELNRYEVNHSEEFYYEIRCKDKDKEFNVPFGKKTKVNTYDGQNLGIIHSYLNFNEITIQNIDFEESVKTAKKGDFIYFDPPYDSDTSTFNSYTEGGFGKEEQVRLARVFKELADKGCYVMLSNHNTTLVKDLYKDFNIHVIEAKRNINSNGKKRGKVEEVIITNYENIRGFE